MGSIQFSWAHFIPKHFPGYILKATENCEAYSQNLTVLEKQTNTRKPLPLRFHNF